MRQMFQRVEGLIDVVDVVGLDVDVDYTLCVGAVIFNFCCLYL